MRKRMEKQNRETRVKEKKREVKRSREEGSCRILPDVWNEVRVHNICKLNILLPRPHTREHSLTNLRNDTAYMPTNSEF